MVEIRDLTGKKMIVLAAAGNRNWEEQQGLEIEEQRNWIYNIVELFVLFFLLPSSSPISANVSSHTCDW